MNNEEEQYVLRKRVPQRPHPRPNDIFVSRSSHKSALVKRGWRLLTADRYNEVHIHGLGAAMEGAVDVALQLCRESHGALRTDCETLTVKLLDDIVPVGQQQDISSRVRLNSAVVIRVYYRDGNSSFHK